MIAVPFHAVFLGEIFSCPSPLSSCLRCPHCPSTHAERYCVPRSFPCLSFWVGSWRSHKIVKSSGYVTTWRATTRKKQGYVRDEKSRSLARLTLGG
jgi:hypothetical protein